jgi:hypothetical protein
MLRFLKNYYSYFPIAGFALYIIVFTLAALQYPGGSFNLPNAEGYSFFHNFLCDVMDPVTKGGVFNPARMLAVVSHIILSLTMISFFYMLPEIFDKRNRNFFMIRYFGMFTMTVFMLMATAYHDLIVTFTGVLGTLALIPFFIELRNYKDKRLAQLACLCFFMSIVVFFIFETKIGFYYLPFLQKITFVLDAWWVIWVSIIVQGKRKKAVCATQV